ncbi:MAG: CPBP family intramembrane metalloprotease [Bacteroidales bacterium]|nr:CPBP family intramembrane metalloprotease [Bacteroidales bacterium]
MKKYLKPLLALVVFLLSQVLVSVIIMTVMTIANIQTTNVTIISVTLIISSIITILLMIKPLNMFDFRRDFRPSGISIGLSVIAIIGAIIGMLGTDFINSALDLPNLLEEQLEGMSNTLMGALAIAVIGPLAEEVVFRGAMMGYMLRNNVKPWTAILVSAFLFGAIHLNPVQVPFAMIVGVIFGVIYYRTGNIILTTIIHIINNSMATYLMSISTDPLQLGENDDTNMLIMSVILSLICWGICYIMLRKLWKSTSDIEYAEPKEEAIEVIE